MGGSMKRTRFVDAAQGIAIVTLVGSFLCTAAPADAQDTPRRLQGQVPLADQLNGRALQGYSEHVRLVGHNNILNRLQNGNLGWLDDCAYVAAYFGANDPTAGL